MENRDNVKRIFINYSKKTGKKYDWVISTRPDVYYSQKLNYNVLDPNSVNIPKSADYGGYQDKVAIGTPNVMIQYLDLYDNLREYLKIKSINPEPLLKHHLKQHKVPVKRLDFKHKIFPKVPHRIKVNQ